MTTKDDPLRELLRILEATEPVEIDCDEFLARVGAVVEHCRTSDQPLPELRAVYQHLEVCGECTEEFDALLRAYGIDRGRRAT